MSAQLAVGDTEMVRVYAAQLSLEDYLPPGVATDGSFDLTVLTPRETQIAHILDRLSDGEWHQVREDLCVLPNGGRITQPTARLSEMRGVSIERRKSPRYDHDGKFLHMGSDWRLR